MLHMLGKQRLEPNETGNETANETLLLALERRAEAISG
jgi:hypothetical protein